MDTPYTQKSYLLNLIERAFAGVQLEDGVSLHEADVIDNYGTNAERQAARATDELEDWHRLDRHELEHMGWVLSFYDDKGFRFHLPAYLTMAVEDYRNEVVDSLLFHLCSVADDGEAYNRQRFAILSSYQRRAVRHVLKYLRHHTGKFYEWDHLRIDRALRNYWTGNKDGTLVPQDDDGV